ncbi:MAG: hypothetical protein ABI809_11440 [Caldimonas sp.]
MSAAAPSLRRQLWVSLWIQGAGAAAVLAATWLLAASLGPEVQGVFSRTKAEIEFVAAFAMFGLPQALFFHVRSGRLGLASALRWAVASALLAVPIGAAYAWWRGPALAAEPFAPTALGAWLVAPTALWASLLLGAAVAAVVLHGQLRALLLLRERTAWFNVATALPQLALLLGVGIAIAAGAATASAWWLLFALAYGAAASLAWQWVRAAEVARAASTAGWRELGHYGLAAWLTAALATAAIVVMQRWVEAAAGHAALGRFTLAMTLVQVPLTPIAYAAPLLLRRWMEQPGAAASRRWAALLFALLIGVAAAVAVVAPAWPDLGLGPAYAGVTAAVAVLLAGAAAEAASRVLTVQAAAKGLPWIAARAECARWIVLALAWIGVRPAGLTALCTLWALAAGAAALVFVFDARRVATQPEAPR